MSLMQTVIYATIISTSPAYALSGSCHIHLPLQRHAIRSMELTSVPPNDPSAEAHLIRPNQIPFNAYIRFQPMGSDAPLLGEVIIAGGSNGATVLAIQEIDGNGAALPSGKIHYLRSDELINETYIFLKSGRPN
jgi:hypothetical protein